MAIAGQAGSTRRYTYADLESFPDDNLRREIIDGELFVAPSPFIPHQRALLRIARALDEHSGTDGGEAFVAPLDVIFSDIDAVEPDLLYLRKGHPSLAKNRHVYEAPDLVVEISSPSTRSVDRGRKRELYERFGVAEYWFVDLDNRLIEQHVLRDGHYLPAVVSRATDSLQCVVLPGLALRVETVLGSPPVYR